MKNNSLKSIYAIVLTALFFIGCSKDDISPENINRGVSLRAVNSQTRTSTALDGEGALQSSWSAGDVMKVAIAGDGYSNSGDFTLSDAINSVFTNTDLALDATKQYSFYGVYPAVDIDSSLETHSYVNVTIGAAEQAQQGSNVAHLAALDPLVGASSEASEPSAATIAMHHTACVLKLNVRNSTGSEIAGIKSVSITAPSGTYLAGEYKVDLKDSNASFILNEGATSTVSVTVESSGAVANGSEFTVWAAVAPFTIGSGVPLKFTVTTAADKVYQIEKSLASNTTFASGSVMATTLELMPETQTISIDFTDTENYPSGFPTSEPNGVNAGTYTIDGQTLHITSTYKFYYKATNNIGLLFLKNNSATVTNKISIPQISGMKPTKLIVTRSNSGGGDIPLNIVYSDGGEDISVAGETITATKKTINLSSTDSSTQYYLKFSTTSSQSSFILSNLEITYSL